MRYEKVATVIGLLGPMLLVGCQTQYAPARVRVPGEHETHARYDRARAKPLPPERRDIHYPAPIEDVPLLSQRPPEQDRFVHAYQQVGRPRITVFINRTPEGQIVPVNMPVPTRIEETVKRSTAGVTVETREHHRTPGYYGDRVDRVERFQSDGPAEYRERHEELVVPSEFDRLGAATIDYQAMETILTDWLAANGRVTIISPMMARQKLTPEQVEALEGGRPQVLSELIAELGADVLVQVQVEPTRQTPEGMRARMVAEALNTRDGISLARAVVDIPPPLEKTQLNHYTRYVARKLMDDMTETWMNLGRPADDRPE